MNEVREIVLCPECHGFGRDDESEDSICHVCEGSGRLLKVTSYERYDSKVDEATKLLAGEQEEEEDFEKELLSQLTNCAKKPMRKSKLNGSYSVKIYEPYAYDPKIK